MPFHTDWTVDVINEERVNTGTIPLSAGGEHTPPLIFYVISKHACSFFFFYLNFFNSLFYSLLHWLAVIIWLPQNDWILINRTLLSNLMETGTITSHTQSSILSPPSFKTFRKNETYHVISLDCLGSGHSGRLCQFSRRCVHMLAIITRFQSLQLNVMIISSAWREWY